MRMGLGLGLAPGLDPSATYAFYTDFKNGLYRSGTTRTNAVSALPGYSFTRSGTKSRFNAAGTTLYTATANNPLIVPGEGYWQENSFTNLLLNAGTSADLGTQTTAALTAVAHTISFYGTGTMTLTGASTAGPLVGTGATNRVSLTFTPTATPLTVTVTGSCKYAGLVVSGYTAGPIIATAGATATVGADDLQVTLVQAAPFTLLTEAKPAPGLAFNFGGQLFMRGYTDANNFTQQYISAGSPTALVLEASVVTASVSAVGTSAVDTVARIAGRYQLNNVNASYNGGAVGVADTSTSPPAIAYVGGNPGQNSDGCIRFLGVKAGAFTDAQLIAASAAYL